MGKCLNYRGCFLKHFPIFPFKWNGMPLDTNYKSRHISGENSENHGISHTHANMKRAGHGKQKF